MAWAAGNACFSTPESAGSFLASSLVRVADGASGPLLLTFTPVAASPEGLVSISAISTPLDGSAPITSTLQFQLEPCQQLTAADGVELGWLFIGALATVFAVKALLLPIRSSDGNT